MPNLGYVEANRGFVRCWEECEGHLPSVADWVLPPPTDSAHSAVLGVSSGEANPERAAFPGWAGWAWRAWARACAGRGSSMRAGAG